jgi:hypothetical protein
VLGLQRLVADELHGDPVPDLETGVQPEVREVLALLLGHVVVVGDPAVGDRLPPAVAAGRVPLRAADALPDLVVVLDRVLDLLLCAVRVGGAGPEPGQDRVEVPFLGLRVGLQQHHEPLPHRGQGLDVVTRRVVERREHPPLLAVLVQDHLGDVHRSSRGSVAVRHLTATHRPLRRCARSDRGTETTPSGCRRRTPRGLG